MASDAGVHARGRGTPEAGSGPPSRSHGRRRGLPSRRAMLAGLSGAVLAGLAPGPSGRARAQGFRIGPGDQLRVEVLEDPSLDRTVLVLPDGTIDFPLAGTIQASGRTVEELRRALTQALGANFAAPPTVFVSVGQLRPPVDVPAPEETDAPIIDVFVTGEVARPGRLAVPPGTTVLQILAEAGGLTRFAAESRIQLRRTDARTGAVTTYLYDYDAAGRRPSIRGGTPLAPGDVVVVPERRLLEF